MEYQKRNIVSYITTIYSLKCNELCFGKIVQTADFTAKYSHQACVPFSNNNRSKLSCSKNVGVDGIKRHLCFIYNHDMLPGDADSDVCHAIYHISARRSLGKVHPSPKVMADFVSDTKFNMIFSSNLHTFGRFIKRLWAVIFYEIYMDFRHWPIMHRGLKATNVFF